MGKVITINGADFSENACGVANLYKNGIQDWDAFFDSKSSTYIDANGVWRWASTNFHIVTPLVGESIMLDATENNLSFGDWTNGIEGNRITIAFFSEVPVPRADQEVVGMIGSRIDIDLGEKVTMDIPSGTKYLYIYAGYHAIPETTTFTSYLPKAIYWD